MEASDTEPAEGMKTKEHWQMGRRWKLGGGIQKREEEEDGVGDGKWMDG